MLESQRERKPSQHWSFLRQNVRESPSAALAYCAAACRVYQITANANVSSDVVAAGGGIMPPRIPTSHFVHHQRIRAYVHALPMLINVCVFFGVGASEARKRSCAPADCTHSGDLASSHASTRHLPSIGHVIGSRAVLVMLCDYANWNAWWWPAHSVMRVFMCVFMFVFECSSIYDAILIISSFSCVRHDRPPLHNDFTASVSRVRARLYWENKHNYAYAAAADWLNARDGRLMRFVRRRTDCHRIARPCVVSHVSCVICDTDNIIGTNTVETRDGITFYMRWTCGQMR